MLSSAPSARSVCFHHLPEWITTLGITGMDNYQYRSQSKYYTKQQN